MVLFAIGHFAGFLTARAAARHDPDLVELTARMRAHRAAILGFHPSILDLREYFSLVFSPMMLLAAALTYQGWRSARRDPVVARGLARLVVVAMLVLGAASLVYGVVQGAIASAAIGAAFGVAWRLARRSAPAA